MKRYTMEMTPATHSQLKLIKYFSVGYIFLFTTLALYKGNYEFLFYSVLGFSAIWYVRHNYRKLYFTKTILVLLSLFGFIHLLAGQLYLNDVRLYDFWLIPDILKFDNVVHTFGGAIMGFISYNFLSFHLDSSIKRNTLVTFFLIVTLGSGMGAYNEIIEFLAVTFLDAADAVGGYTNTALDIVFNFIGACLTAFIVVMYRTRK